MSNISRRQHNDRIAPEMVAARFSVLAMESGMEMAAGREDFGAFAFRRQAG